MTNLSDIGDADFARAYGGDTAALRDVRADVSAWLRERGEDDDTVDRTVLIASELATNAIHAAHGETFTVMVHGGDGEHVELTIRNPCPDGADLPPPAMWVPPTPSATSGRGLSIVAALSDDVSVQVESDHVSVTARIRSNTSK